MSLVSEWALSPDVFDASAYASSALCDAHLGYMKRALLEEVVVRDLRDGEWRKVFADAGRPWSRKGRELLRKLQVQRRLVPAPAARSKPPSTDSEWVEEALGSHLADSLDAIVAGPRTADGWSTEPLVGSVQSLGDRDWWAPTTVSVSRTTEGYARALALLIRRANSLCFFDPHLDPSVPRYRAFADVLALVRQRVPQPLIEIHRVSSESTGRHREPLPLDEWKARFRSGWGHLLAGGGPDPVVYLWDRFHDRFVITDVVGINCSNGFDTASPRDSVKWSRLDRDSRDDVQREFHPNAGRHRLFAQFRLSDA